MGSPWKNLNPLWPAVEAEALTLLRGSESHRGATAGRASCAGSYSDGREKAARSAPA